MTRQDVAALMAHFSEMEDPRSAQGKLHRLSDILIIAICAVICGADSWVEVELFGKSKEAWFRSLLELPHGIPSHDTFGRVFRMLDPEAFQRGFASWMASVQEVTKGQVIAVDRKTLRGSRDRGLGKRAIELVGAWATANRLLLGPVQVAEGSNEITALPDLLQLLFLEGCIVTIDALGCQEKIVQTIVKQGGDYLLALKGNQKQLYEAVQDLFVYAEETQFREVASDYCQTVSKGHGRIEIRRCWTIAEPDFLEYVRAFADWPDLETLVKIEAERRTGEKTTRQTRYYISSLENNARQVLQAAREHWRIENQVHWVLDVAFREDHSRIRAGNGAQNFGILRRLALSLLQQDRTSRVGIKAKRLKAALDNRYLLTVLMGTTR